MRPNAWLSGSLVVAALLAGGCDSGPAEEDFLPPAEVAANALTAVLQNWQQGAPEEELHQRNPAIHTSDTQRVEGRLPVSFEILGEAPVDGGRRFAVRLKFAAPAEETDVQYVVVGIDPIWVFRKEDYDLLSHWDHAMPPAEDAAAETAAGAGE